MYSYDHDPLLARWYGAYFTRKLRNMDADLIYAPAGSACIAHLKSALPVVYFSDATWRLVLNYYPNFSNVIRRTATAAERLERAAIERSAVCLFSSEWAVASAIRDYGANPDHTHNVHIGANLVNPPTAEVARSRRIGSRIRLLFIGALWDVKGGDIAYAALQSLLDRGHDATLTVVGCEPPYPIANERVEVLGYLNKQEAQGKARFDRLWSEADFFVLPSRCEAAGIVFCEAAAHGLPVLTTATGGIPSIVVDGENGYTLPLGATGSDYADRISEIAADPERYAALCVASRRAFEERLNWDTWGEQVADHICEAVPTLAPRIREWQQRQRTQG